MIIYKDYLISDVDHRTKLVPQGSLRSPHVVLILLSAPDQSRLLKFSHSLLLVLSFSCPVPVLNSSYKVIRNLGGKGELKESL